MDDASLQLGADGALAHLLTLKGLTAGAARRLFARADEFAGGARARRLQGKLLANIFFESSTRTRTAFEAAARQLGADVVNLDQISMAGETKKESLEDTVRTVAAMGAAGIVLRHGEDGAAAKAALAARAAPSDVKIINGGDGCNQHPTQGLTDAYTLLRHFGAARLPSLRVAIAGDVLHSRVARSNVHILRALGVEAIKLTGPAALCPPALQQELGAPVLADLDEALADADVVMLLRIQRERLAAVQDDTPELWEAEENAAADGGGDNAMELRAARRRARELAASGGAGAGMGAADYLAKYGLTAARAAALGEEAVIMHPGPINRGVEIADEVADGEKSLILRQVTLGMAIRMAVLTELIVD